MPLRDALVVMDCNDFLEVTEYKDFLSSIVFYYWSKILSSMLSFSFLDIVSSL
jgi:hypothetical protein